MIKTALTTRIALILFFAFSGITQSYAARYSLEQLPANLTIAGINNVGTIVGLDETAMPFVWTIDKDSNSYSLGTKLSLPTTELGVPTGSGFTEIHVTAINNEQSAGTGADIIGWYIDNNGAKQSVLWYQKETAREQFFYNSLTLPPLREKARACTNDRGSNFLTPECLRLGFDDVLIQGAKTCDNSSWTYPDPFLLAPCDQPPVPICEYSMTKTKSSDQTPTSQNDTASVKYDYGYNPDYNPSLDHPINACIFREHAEIAILASKCAENTGWVDNTPTENTDPIQPTILTCDTQSKAFGINNNSTIVGASYDANDNPHPVSWFRVANNLADGIPKYVAVNLGLERIDVTPESIKQENDSRGELDPEKSPSIKLNRRLGEAQITSVATGDVAGFLQQDPTDTYDQYKPYYWPKVLDTGIEPPFEMLSPDTDSKGNYRQFSAKPNLTAISSRLVGGWYQDDSNRTRAVQWLLAPGRDSNNQVIDILTPKLEPMLEPGEKGKILHNSFSGETIGQSKVTNTNNQTEDHAFYKSSKCGIQDLNQLLVTPTIDGTLLTSAYKIASGVFPNTIIATGITPGTPSTGDQYSYALKKEDVFVNLKIDIATDNDRLTVGDEYAYFITLSNNGKPDDVTPENYATCVVFVLEAAVYTPEPDENGLPREELLAGLTFLSYESTADITCKISPIRIICGLDQLNTGSPVSVKILTTPRALLADRRVKASVSLYSTEQELPSTLADNSTFIISSVDRRGCFIATAAYGSYLSPEVKGLRQFRDRVLLKFGAGRWLVETYYDISPPYADYISQHEELRTVSRWVLSPLVYLILYPLPITSGIILLFYFGYRVRARRRQI
ncbi:MAG: hypothetical protein OEM38_01235 [Gammaproteobacteria bacterium]|nr:hypothetical protein [Gammaproteobacteria bacterium]